MNLRVDLRNHIIKRPVNFRKRGGLACWGVCGRWLLTRTLESLREVRSMVESLVKCRFQLAFVSWDHYTRIWINDCKDTAVMRGIAWKAKEKSRDYRDTCPFYQLMSCKYSGLANIVDLVDTFWPHGPTNCRTEKLYLQYLAQNRLVSAQ